MACNEYGWWYFNNGQLNLTFNGLADNEYGTWFYTNGQLNFGFTGMLITALYIGRQRYTVPLFLWYNASVDFLNRNLII